MNAGGTCKNSGQTNSCNRGTEDLCTNDGNSGSNEICCKACNTAACKQEEAEWAKSDTECVLQGGSCKFNSLSLGLRTG
jgi:hypothetical protein